VTRKIPGVPNPSPGDATREKNEPQARYFVQSLERGLAVIRAFAADAPLLSSSDVASRTGLTRAAARRFLLTLVDLGYVTTDGRLFQLTPKVLELGYSFLSSLGLPDLALGHVEQLVVAVEEASEMAILDGDQIVYVLRVPGPQLLTISVNVGARMPAHASSLGRVLLAGLPEAELAEYLRTARLQRFLPRTITSPPRLRREIDRVRRNGYAVVDQELEDGLVAVAVPIHDRSGRVVAALNLSTNAARRGAAELESDLLPRLRQTAGLIEADLHNARGQLVSMDGHHTATY
jgi:IclR family pca regulon transcriptional regulator